MQVDRRPEFRKDAFKFGLMKRAGAADLSCLVWDLSSMRAKLEFEDSGAAPETLALQPSLEAEFGNPGRRMSRAVLQSFTSARS